MSSLSGFSSVRNDGSRKKISSKQVLGSSNRSPLRSLEQVRGRPGVEVGVLGGLVLLIVPWCWLSASRIHGAHCREKALQADGIKEGQPGCMLRATEAYLLSHGSIRDRLTLLLSVES